MSRALLQQALDALHVSTTPLAKDRQEVLRAIAALQAALDVPETDFGDMPEPVAYSSARGLHWHHGKGISDVLLYARPAVPLTEIKQIENDLRSHGFTLVKTVTGYAVLKLGQINAHGVPHISECSDVQLYTRPAVPLTDEQIINALGGELDSDDSAFIKFARAIEAAHGIKPISECSDGEIYSRISARDHKPDWSAP